MTTGSGSPQLFNAVQSGNMEEVEKLVNAGCDINAGDEQGYTPLHMAVGKRHSHIVDYLIACGASVNTPEKNGMTPVHTAIISNNPVIVKSLVSHGADLSRGMVGDGTVLHDVITIWSGHRNAADKVEIIRILLNAGVNIHTVNRMGNNALDEAYISLSQVKIGNNTLTISPDGDSGMKKRDPDLDKNMQQAMQVIIPILEHRGARPGAMSEGARAILGRAEQPHGPLFSAVIDNDQKKVRELLKKGADPNEKESHGATPLHYASGHGHLEIAKFLILMGADVNAMDSLGCTPLHGACGSLMKDIAELLISRGADIHAADNEGLTALHMAAYGGGCDLVSFLLSKGAEANARDIKGDTPMKHAASQHHTEVMEILSAAGQSGGASTAGVNRKTSGPAQATAGSRREQDESDDEVALSKRLYSAVEHGDLDMLKALVDKGADVSGRTSVFDKTPLHWAAFFKQEAVAEYLLEKGALIEALDAEERTPLHMAALEGSLEILEIFLRAGASVNKKDRAGKSAIHGAAEKGTGEMVTALIRNGADGGDRAGRGDTPLHWAAFKGNIETAGVLLSRGADANAADDDGYTPLNWSQMEGRREMSRFLHSRGARQAGIFGILKRTYDNKVKEVKKIFNDRTNNDH